jgi:hypothetical protein
VQQPSKQLLEIWNQREKKAMWPVIRPKSLTSATGVPTSYMPNFRDNFDPDFDRTICRKFQLDLNNLPA